MLVLVTYDINVTSTEGQRRLRRVARQCVNYGTRVQCSVFECRVNASEFTLLKHLLLQEIDPKLDSVRFYRLGNHYADLVEHYGVIQGIDTDGPLIM